MTAADHRTDDGTFVFAIGFLAVVVDLATFIRGDHLVAVVRCRAADAFLRAVVMAGGFGFRALFRIRIGFEVGQCGTGFDDVAGGAVQLDDLAGVRRGYVDDRLGGFHRAQRGVELDAVAHLDVPLDHGSVGQAFAEVGQVESLDISHESHP